MRIFILGNINSGKSHLVKQLSKIFNGSIYQLDEYRKKYSDATIESEELCKKRFVNDVMLDENCIVEFSGGGSIAIDFFSRLNKKEIIILHVQEELEICIKRLEQKDFSCIPYPNYGVNISDTIINLHNQFITNKYIENEWSKYAIEIINCKSSYNIDSLCITHYETIHQIVSLFLEEEVSLFSFGSTARKEINTNSDIDLYLLTNNNVEYILNIISKKFTKVSRSNNQIIIDYNEIIVELYIENEISNCERYYFFSNVVDIKNSILIDNFTKDLYDKLTFIMTNYHFDIKEEIKSTEERLIYFINSLNKLILKDDMYKFYFHTNIIVHEFIKLKYFNLGNTKFHYLPKNATSFVDSKTFESILYKFGENMIEYEKRIKKLLIKDNKLVY